MRGIEDSILSYGNPIQRVHWRMSGIGNSRGPLPTAALHCRPIEELA